MSFQAPTTSNSRRMVGIAMGILLATAGLTGTLVLSQRGSGGPLSPGPTPSAPTATKPVVETASALTAGTQLTAANTVVVDVPVSGVPDGAFFSPNQVAGAYLQVDVTAHEPLTAGLITRLPDGVTAPAQVLFPQLKTGDVAMAIPVDDQKGVGGWIQPGDHIDIIVDGNGQGAVHYGFQDIVVLRIGQPADQAVPTPSPSPGASAAPPSGGKNVSLLVVELTRRQAEQMAALISGRGTPAVVLRYVIRPIGQDGKGPLDSQPDGAVPKPNDPPLSPGSLSSLFS